MRRLRAGLVTPPPGGPGTRSGGTKAAPQGACWTGTVPPVSGRTKARQADEANWRCGPRKKPGRKPGNADPGNRNRRRGAPRGARAPQGARHDRIPAAPRGATPPRASCGGRLPGPSCRGSTKGPAQRGRNDGVPGAAKNPGAEAWLFENLTALRRSARQSRFPSPLVGEGGERGAIASASRVRGFCRS